MRPIFHTLVLFLTICVGLSQAHAEIPYAQFMENCVGPCSKGADKTYCASYCQCTVDGLKASGDEAAQNAAIANQQTMQEITMNCAGKFSVDLFLKSCKAACKQGNCAICDCVAGEVKSLGPNNKIGELFYNIARGDALAKEQMGAMQAKCAK